MADLQVRIPQSGAVAALESWLVHMTNGPFRAHLYGSNTPYLPTRVLADYTESAFAGYAAVSISWGLVGVNLAGKAESDGGSLGWTFTGSSGTANVYGIYLTDSADSLLLAVIPFLSPVVLSPANRSIGYGLKLTDTSEV